MAGRAATTAAISHGQHGHAEANVVACDAVVSALRNRVHVVVARIFTWSEHAGAVHDGGTYTARFADKTVVALEVVAASHWLAVRPSVTCRWRTSLHARLGLHGYDVSRHGGNPGGEDEYERKAKHRVKHRAHPRDHASRTRELER